MTLHVHAVCARQLWGMSDREFRARAREQLVDDVPAHIIIPTSRFRVTWDLIAIILVLYTSVLMPYRMAFLESFAVDGW